MVGTEGQIRRATSLVIWFEGSNCVVRNYLQLKAFRCSLEWLGIFRALESWTSPKEVAAILTSAGIPGDSEKQLGGMIRLGGLVRGGTPEAERDELLASKWEWDHFAGLFHFGTRMQQTSDYESGDQDIGFMILRSITKGWPQLTASNGNGPQVVALPEPNPDSTLLNIMKARRSRRVFASAPIPLSALSDILFAGLGITGFMRLDKPPRTRPPLPLRMTPSGGALNSIEAYVYAANITGLEPGVYRYDGVDKTLGPIAHAGRLPELDALLGGQPWIKNCAAAIVLAGVFERAVFRYHHPAGYAVVAIEAGHVAQNLLLAMTDLGVAGAPTTSLTHALWDKLLGFDGISRTAFHAVVLGAPSQEYETHSVEDVKYW